MLIAVVLAGLCRGNPAVGDAAPAPSVGFTWAFVHTNQRGVARVLDFSADPTVASGDRMRVFVEPVEGTYVYLYLFDSARELALIFPPTPRFYDQQSAPAREYYVPDAGAFLMDAHTGTEKFYLFASATRLTGLETLTAQYLQQRTPELKTGLLNALVSTQREYSGIAGAAEKGVPIAGTVVTRGVPNVTGEATQVDAKGVYTKVLRLKHE